MSNPPDQHDPRDPSARLAQVQDAPADDPDLVPDIDLENYPIRPPDEDPGWAKWIVWIWVIIAVASIVFILALLVAGIFYD